MKIFFDTEFIENGVTIDLLSIALVTEHGDEYYAEPPCSTEHATQWVQQNVLPHLSHVKRPRKQIAAEIRNFVGPSPEFYADYGAYDWVALCQLYGPMTNLPPGWPMYVRDLQMIAPGTDLVSSVPHHALHDARALRSYILAMERNP